MTKVWKGTWKPDGTGGWHTKTEDDIVERYNSARIAPVPTQMLKDAIDEVVRLRSRIESAEEAYVRLDASMNRLKAAFRVNMLRAFPDMSHEEIDAEIEAAIRESDK